MSKASKRTKRLKLAGTRDETRRSAAVENVIEAPAAEVSSVRVPGTPTTRYATDPLGGNGRAHAILRLHRDGAQERRIAKVLNVSLAEVREVLRKAAKR